MADFVKTTWVDNSDPAITAAQLNRIEAGILDAIQGWKTGTLAARPAANAASKFWAYFATDDTGGTLYVNFDGANWTKVAAGLSAAGGGATWAYDAESSAVTFVDVTGLAGDTDLAYEVFLDGVVTVGGVARNITARPNNLVANTENTYAADNRTGTNVSVGSYDSNGFFVAYTTAADSIIASRSTLFAKTGRVRKWLSNALVSPSASAAQTIVMEDGGRWDDTTTNITSLRVDFGGGTYTGRVRVRKL